MASYAHQADFKLKNWFINVRWGAMSLIGLYLSVFSGVLIGLQYDVATPYYSTNSIEILVPFGSFWRSLHFYSSQMFFLFSLVHFLAIILDTTFQSIPVAKWIKLILSLIFSLLLLFSGYILRGDLTGSSAGMIAENILLSIPFIGYTLNSMLFSIIEDGMQRVYVNHLVGFAVIWLLLVWDHLRRYRVGLRDYQLLFILTIAFSAVVKAPMEPEHIGVFHINGPWFFIGLQEGLRYFPALIAGFVWPLIFLLAIMLLPHKKYGKFAAVFTCVWLVVYAGLTVIGLLR